MPVPFSIHIAFLKFDWSLALEEVWRWLLPSFSCFYTKNRLWASARHFYWQVLVQFWVDRRSIFIDWPSVFVFSEDCLFDTLPFFPQSLYCRLFLWKWNWWLDVSFGVETLNISLVDIFCFDRVIQRLNCLTVDSDLLFSTRSSCPVCWKSPKVLRCCWCISTSFRFLRVRSSVWPWSVAFLWSQVWRGNVRWPDFLTFCLF